jgi:hypothetical protein
MKKNLVLSVVLVALVLVGCATIPSSEYEKFEGVWKQVEGTATITFKGKTFDMVDVENGILRTENLKNKNKKGTFKLTSKRGQSRLEFQARLITDPNKAWSIFDKEKYSLNEIDNLIKSNNEKSWWAEENGELVFHYSISNVINSILPYSFDDEILILRKWEYDTSNDFSTKSVIGRFIRQ